MRWLLCCLTVPVLAVLLLPAAPTALAQGEKSEKEWVQLFNGKDLTGWKLFPNPNPKVFESVEAREKDGKVVAYVAKLKKGGEEVPLWRVEEGVLIGSGPASH